MHNFDDVVDDATGEEEEPAGPQQGPGEKTRKASWDE